MLELTAGHVLLHSDLRIVCDIMRRGGICIMPCDTCYTLAALPHRLTTIAALRAMFPGRPNEPISLSFGSTHMLNQFVRLTSLDHKLLEQFAPGPMTLVCRLTNAMKVKALSGIADTLNHTLGVRIPDSSVERQLSVELEHPITTYAIRVEQDIIRSFRDAYDYIATKLDELEDPPEVAGIRNPSPLKYPDHSTVVTVQQIEPEFNIPHVYREGIIDARTIERLVDPLRKTLPQD